MSPKSNLENTNRMPSAWKPPHAGREPKHLTDTEASSCTDAHEASPAALAFRDMCSKPIRYFIPPTYPPNHNKIVDCEAKKVQVQEASLTKPNTCLGCSKDEASKTEEIRTPTEVGKLLHTQLLLGCAVTPQDLPSLSHYSSCQNYSCSMNI